MTMQSVRICGVMMFDVVRCVVCSHLAQCQVDVFGDV